jgi:hypothetical protein
MKREPVSLAEFKKLHRIPEELPLLGYIIHRLDTDEFLYFYQDSPYSTLCGWSRIPMLAILYDDDKQAIKLVDEELESPCIVSLLFDSRIAFAPMYSLTTSLSALSRSWRRFFVPPHS